MSGWRSQRRAVVALTQSFGRTRPSCVPYAVSLRKARAGRNPYRWSHFAWMSDRRHQCGIQPHIMVVDTPGFSSISAAATQMRNASPEMLYPLRCAAVSIIIMEDSKARPEQLRVDSDNDVLAEPTSNSRQSGLALRLVETERIGLESIACVSKGARARSAANVAVLTHTAPSAEVSG